MIAYIDNFLKHRKFRVKVNNCYSDWKDLENGVPQGTVLSVLLFLVAINDINEHIKFPLKFILYADDLVIMCSGDCLKSVQTYLQTTLLSLQNWSQKTGFTFSDSKTKCMLFCKSNIHDLIYMIYKFNYN